MKKFKFNLEAVLKDRKRIEESKLRDWTIARTFLQAMLDDLTRLEAALKNSIQEMTDYQSQASGALEVHVLKNLDAYIQGNKKKIEWKIQEISKGTKLTEKKRQEYLVASSRRKTIEKLKEKRFSEYLSLRKKKELLQLDDLYTARAGFEKRQDDLEGEQGS